MKKDPPREVRWRHAQPDSTAICPLGPLGGPISQLGIELMTPPTWWLTWIAAHGWPHGPHRKGPLGPNPTPSAPLAEHGRTPRPATTRRHLTGDQRDLVLRPATAATPCWARSATHCASPRPWPPRRLDGEAHAHLRLTDEERQQYRVCRAPDAAAGQPRLPAHHPEATQVRPIGHCLQLSADIACISWPTVASSSPSTWPWTPWPTPSCRVLTTTGDGIRWEGIDAPMPEHLIDWRGNGIAGDAAEGQGPSPNAASPPRLRGARSSAPAGRPPRAWPSTYIFGGPAAPNDTAGRQASTETPTCSSQLPPWPL